MELSKELFLEVADEIKNADLNYKYYDMMDATITEIINKIMREQIIEQDSISFLLSADHMLGTNLQFTSPITYFVGYKANKAQIAALNKASSLSRRARRLMDNMHHDVITSSTIAKVIFNHLINYFDENTKLVINNNIIMLNINGEVKVRIICGYNFTGNMEYDYFNNYHYEYCLDLIQNVNQKDDKTGNFKILTKIVRSIELELNRLGKVNTNYYSNINFLEHLMYNIPNELISGELYESFVNALNYLKNANLKEFKLATVNEPMFDEMRYKTSEAKDLINMLVYFYSNF